MFILIEKIKEKERSKVTLQGKESFVNERRGQPSHFHDEVK